MEYKYNNFSGTIPDWLSNISILGYLGLSSNNVEGLCGYVVSSGYLGEQPNMIDEGSPYQRWSVIPYRIQSVVE